MILRPGKYQLAPGTWTLAPGTSILALGTWTCDLLICTRQLNWHAPAPRLLVRRSLKDAQILYTAQQSTYRAHATKRRTHKCTQRTHKYTPRTHMYTPMHTNTQTHTLHLPKSRLATPVATLHRSLLPSTINYQRAAYSQMFNHFMVTHYHLIVLLIVDKINLRRQSYSSADGRGQESVDELKMQNSYFRQC